MRRLVPLTSFVLAQFDSYSSIWWEFHFTLKEPQNWFSGTFIASSLTNGSIVSMCLKILAMKNFIFFCIRLLIKLYDNSNDSRAFLWLISSKLSVLLAAIIKAYKFSKIIHGYSVYAKLIKCCEMHSEKLIPIVF